MLEADGEERLGVFRAPKDLKYLLSIFFNCAQVCTLAFFVLLTQVEQVHVMIVAHIRC